MQGFTVPDSDRIEQPPSIGPGIRQVIPPAPPKPRDPLAVRKDELDIKLKEKELAKAVGGPAALTAEDRGKFTRQRQGALGLKRRIEEVESLYNQNFKGGGLGAAVEYAPGIIRPENEVFKNAGGALMGDLAAAYGLTAQQQNTPTELEIRFGPYIPKPGDRDEVIEAKIRRLKEVAAEQERQALTALGESEKEEQPAPALTAPSISDGGGGPDEPPGLSFDPSGNVIHPDSGGGLMEGNATGVLGFGGGTHLEVNPALAGANAHINGLLKKGAPDAAIISYLSSKGAEPASIRSILEQARKIKLWRKQNPGYKGDFNIDVERFEAPNSAWQNFANSDLGVGTSSGLDAAMGFSTDNLIGMTGGDSEQARLALDAAQAAHPKSAAIGTIAGGVGSALALEGAAGKLGLSGLPRTMAADAAYGGLAGAGATDYADDGSPATVADRLIGAGKGSAAAVAGGLAGQGVAATGRAAARGSRDPYVAAINQAEVPTTVGQQYTGKLGGIIKRTEDRIAGLPLIGDIINARRAEGISKWNERVFDRTLEPIGVKANGKVGEAGIDYAQDKISEAFQKALSGKAVVPDAPMAADLTKAVYGVKTLPRVGDEVADNVAVILEPYMGPGATSLSGDAMQQISRELRDLKAGYYKDPLKKRIGDAIDKVEDSIFGPFRRQHPGMLEEYDKAKLAQRRLYIVADAVNAAKNQEGVFMPSQLGQADRRGTIKMEGKVSAARGRGQFHDMQRAAQEVLPGRIPDSGTAGRIIIPGIALGAGGASDASGMTNGSATTLAAILSLAYTRAGQRALTKPGRGMSGRAGRVLKSDRTRKLLTAGGAATGAGLATQQ